MPTLRRQHLHITLCGHVCDVNQIRYVDDSAVPAYVSAADLLSKTCLAAKTSRNISEQYAMGLSWKAGSQCRYHVLDIRYHILQIMNYMLCIRY